MLHNLSLVRVNVKIRKKYYLVLSSVIHNLLEYDFVHELVSLDGLFLGDPDELLLERTGPVAVVKVKQPCLQIDAKERRNVLKLNQFPLYR